MHNIISLALLSIAAAEHGSLLHASKKSRRGNQAGLGNAREVRKGAWLPHRDLAMLLLDSPPLAFSTFMHGHPRSRTHRRVDARLQEAGDEPQVSWIEVAEVPEEEPSEGATVMPVFPMHLMAWPSHEVKLNIIDPAYIKMYDDILLSGSRKFLMPWSPCVPGTVGTIRFGDMPEEERKLHAVGMVLYLDDLKEVSDQKGVVKYEVSHKVLGRARMKRLLNPSALFVINQDGYKVDYLRAEIEMYDEIDDKFDSPLPKALAEELMSAFQDLAEASKQLDEPRVDENQLSTFVATSNTWQLSELWQGLCQATRLHRAQNEAEALVDDWLKSQREAGNIPNVDAKMLNAADLNMPEWLMKKLFQTQDASYLELSTEFFEPLLQLVAAEGPSARGKLLLKAVRAECDLQQARVTLKNVMR